MGCNLGRCNNLLFLENTDLHVGAANSTLKNVGLGKFWQDLEILRVFLISLEVSFLHGLFLPFSSLKTFHQGVLCSDF